MIHPSELHPGAIQMLTDYMHSEINQALGERRVLEEKWKLYLKAYRAVPDQEIKTFPFYGASNLVIPVIASDVDVIFARIMGILFAPDNFFSTRPTKPEMVEFAPRLQEFLHAVQNKELDIYNVASDFVMELTKLGTGILKTRYRREHKTVYEYRELGGQSFEQHRRIRTKDHPKFDHVSLFDFLLPATALDIQSSPWVGERILLTWQQYMNRIDEGIYVATPRLSNWNATTAGSNVLEHMMSLDSYKTGRGNKLEFWETWLNFDVQGIGEPRAIVATFHLPTFSLVRLDWNPYISQEYPYDAARFQRQEKRFYGIGMCEMLWPFQDEVTAMHNQRIDNGTLANSLVFKGRSGVIQDDEPIFPGRWFILDNLEDVQTMPLSEGKYDSSVQYEPMTMQYAKNRSGVNEHIAGQFAPSIGYAAYGTNLQQLQQATQRFDQTLREIRSCFGSGITRIVELYQQFDRPGKAYQILGQKDGQIIQNFIEFPTEMIRDGVAIEVTATSASLNKDQEIRTNTILMELTSNFYGQVLQGVMMAANPQMPPEIRALILQMVQGGTILMRRIMANYGIQDTDDIVPHIRDILSGQLPIGQLIGETHAQGIGGTQGINAGPQIPGFSQGFGNGGPGMLGPNGNGIGPNGTLPTSRIGSIL